MGSLLPGWSSSSSDADQAIKRSNSSMTNEEVEKFWKSRRLQEQEHLEGAHKDAALSPRMRIAKAMSDEMEAQQKLAEANGLSMSLPEGKSKGWWRKSTWAFLNDPPVVEQKHSRYMPQFDVARLGQLRPEEQLQTDHPSF